jgi:hypothetical protein
VNTSQHCWSGLPSSSWAAFVAQERIPQRWDGVLQHHNTPDANLAWLLAVMGSGSSSSSGSSSNEGSSSGTEGTDTAHFVASCEFTGPRPGFVYKRGSCGLGYYRDIPPPMAAAVAAAVIAAAPSQSAVDVDLSSCTELLQELAALSRGNRCDTQAATAVA